MYRHSFAIWHKKKLLPHVETVCLFGLPRKLPETICIDEFKGNTGIWSSRDHRWYLTKYHCGISNGDAHTVIDVLDQISGVAVNRYFHQFSPTQRRQVKYFCRLNDMVDQVRLRYQNQFTNTGDMTSEKSRVLPVFWKPKEINQQKHWEMRYHEIQPFCNDKLKCKRLLQP